MQLPGLYPSSQVTSFALSLEPFPGFNNIDSKAHSSDIIRFGHILFDLAPAASLVTLTCLDWFGLCFLREHRLVKFVFAIRSLRCEITRISDVLKNVILITS
jgi:hypothetical protein